MYSGRTQVGKAVAVSYISIIFSVLSGLLYSPWLIRELGSSDYAIYSICVSLMAYFTIDFGIGASITRFIAKYRAANEEEKINSVLGIAFKLYLVIDLIAVAALVIMYFLLEHIYIGLTANELVRLKAVFLITGGMIVCCIPVMPLNGVFVAFGRVYDVKKFDLLQKVLTVGLIVISLLSGQGLYAVVFINAMMTVGINTLKLLSIYKKENIVPVFHSKNRDITNELLAFSSWVALTMIADKFFFSFEPTLLGIFSDTKAISIFAVTTAIEGYILLFADGLNGVFLPQVTKMVVQKREPQEITDLMIRIGRIQLLVVSLFTMGIITQGRDFVIIWFGPEYELAYDAAVVILIPCFIHLTQSIATETLYATSQVRYRAIAYVVSSVTNVIVTALLAPKLGAMGAAIGIACGFWIGHELILNIVYMKVLRLDIKAFFCQCHLSALPWIVGMLIIGVIVAKLWPVATKLEILLRCGGCGLCYLVTAVLLYLNQNEKRYLKKIIGKIAGNLSKGE